MGGAAVICPDCRSKQRPKRRPYGTKRTRAWCDKCDAAFAEPLPNKKRERQVAKLEAKKEARRIK